MKYAEYFDVAIILDEVGDAVVPVNKHSDWTDRRTIALPNLRKFAKNLSSFVDALDSPQRRGWIFRGNVFENIREPSFSLKGPSYFCHERMRRCMSSFDKVRLACESASPR
jgi:hypothetical protein